MTVVFSALIPVILKKIMILFALPLTQAQEKQAKDLLKNKD